MCTSDCKCFEGENGEIKEMWTAYGDEVLMKYGRNDIDTFERGPNGTETYPFKWTDDPSEAQNTFKECYDNVLKPEGKYFGLEEFTKPFYEDGGFQLLVGLEHEHKTCASICEIPLFFLTKDISLGKPQFECIDEQLKESQALA
jgi:hypothetical protein